MQAHASNRIYFSAAKNIHRGKRCKARLAKSTINKLKWKFGAGFACSERGRPSTLHEQFLSLRVNATVRVRQRSPRQTGNKQFCGYDWMHGQPVFSWYDKFDSFFAENYP